MSATHILYCVLLENLEEVFKMPLLHIHISRKNIYDFPYIHCL